MTNSSGNESKRVPELDGIRGIAILLIIIWHYGNNQLAGNQSFWACYFKSATSYFWSGVDLFFVLSGFLLGRILLKNKASKSYFKTFYIRRICRIFPIYFLTLLIVFFICYIGIGYSTDWWFNDKIHYWSYLTFTQNIFMGIKETLGNRWISHTWSLALEEQFYLLLPVMIYFLERKMLIIILSVCIISAPFFRHFSDNWYQAFNFLYCRFDALFSGVIVAVAMQNSSVMQFFNRFNKIFSFILLAMLFFTFLFSARILNMMYHIENLWFAFAYSLFIIVVMSNRSNIFSRLARNAILVKAGIISYGIYLYHPVVAGLMHWIIKKQTPQINSVIDMLITCGSFLLTIIVSGISFKYIEKFFINHAHSYKY